MTIYLDIIFLENFILNFIILYATGIEAKSEISFFKIITGSIIGSLYVILYYIFKIEFFLNIFMKIILSITMTYISFYPKSLKILLKQVLFFYLTTFIFAGGALAIIYIVNSGKVSIINGIIMGKYSFLVILLGILVAFLGIITGFKFIKGRVSKRDFLCGLTIKINNSLINIVAMIDTGNLLKEPITNIPVIVVEDSVFQTVIPSEILENTQKILRGNLDDISEDSKKEYLPKLKVIPFMSIGKQNGLMLGIKVEKVMVKIENENRIIDKAIIGLYNQKLCRNGKYQALIGMIW